MRAFATQVLFLPLEIPPRSPEHVVFERTDIIREVPQSRFYQAQFRGREHNLKGDELKCLTRRIRRSLNKRLKSRNRGVNPKAPARHRKQRVSAAVSASPIASLSASLQLPRAALPKIKLPNSRRGNGSFARVSPTDIILPQKEI